MSCCPTHHRPTHHFDPANNKQKVLWMCLSCMPEVDISGRNMEAVELQDGISLLRASLSLYDLQARLHVATDLHRRRFRLYFPSTARSASQPAARSRRHRYKDHSSERRRKSASKPATCILMAGAAAFDNPGARAAIRHRNRTTMRPAHLASHATCAVAMHYSNSCP